jgi:hypothetical protein
MEEGTGSSDAGMLEEDAGEGAGGEEGGVAGDLKTVREGFMIPSRVCREGGKMMMIFSNQTSLEGGQMMMQLSELQFQDLHGGGTIQVVGRIRMVGGGEGRQGEDLNTQLQQLHTVFTDGETLTQIMEHIPAEYIIWPPPGEGHQMMMEVLSLEQESDGVLKIVGRIHLDAAGGEGGGGMYWGDLHTQLQELHTMVSKRETEAAATSTAAEPSTAGGWRGWWGGVGWRGSSWWGAGGGGGETGVGGEVGTRDPPPQEEYLSSKVYTEGHLQSGY